MMDAIVLQPGDLVAHHGETIHRADANASSDRQRRALGTVTCDIWILCRTRCMRCVRCMRCIYWPSNPYQRADIGLVTPTSVQTLA